MISGYTQGGKYKSLINPCCDGPFASRCSSYYDKQTFCGGGGGGGSLSQTDLNTLLATLQLSVSNMIQDQITSLINNLDCSTNIYLNDHYKDLATYSTTLQQLLDSYSQGDFYAVANAFTQDVYNQMAVDINNLALDPAVYPYYEELRLMLIASLEGLKQSTLQYATMVNLESQLTSCQEYQNILYDPVKLQEFLNSLKKTVRIFPDVSVKVMRAEVKQEYLEYIKLYGYPPGGIFEMDKMAPILKQLYPDQYA